MSGCARCHAPLRWVQTEQGNAMPLDLEPNPAGNVEMTDRWATSRMGTSVPVVRVLGAGVEALPLEGLEPAERWMTHFATCPFAEDFRRSTAALEVAGPDPDPSPELPRLVRRGTQLAAILLDLAEAPRGRTAHELATLDSHLARLRPGISVRQAASRLAELLERGLVEPFTEQGADLRRAPVAGERLLVHGLTARGRVEVTRLRAREAGES